MKKYNFGDKVKIGDRNGIIIRKDKKRKYTYYFIIFEDWEMIETDWLIDGASFSYFREDKL